MTVNPDVLSLKSICIILLFQNWMKTNFPSVITVHKKAFINMCMNVPWSEYLCWCSAQILLRELEDTIKHNMM